MKTFLGSGIHIAICLFVAYISAVVMAAKLYGRRWGSAPGQRLRLYISTALAIAPIGFLAVLLLPLAFANGFNSNLNFTGNLGGQIAFSILYMGTSTGMTYVIFGMSLRSMPENLSDNYEDVF
ncbi:MAG: hypothetical protein ACPGGK_04235 [Pikeienuella sp.]